MRAKESSGVWIAVASFVLGAMFLVPMSIGSAEKIVLSDASHGYGDVNLVTDDTSYRLFRAEDSSTNLMTVDCSISHDGGISWSDPASISSGMPHVMRISAGVYGSNLCVAWEDATSRAFTTYYSFSTDSGKAWSRPVELGGAHPSVAIGESGYFIATTLSEGSLRVASGQNGMQATTEDFDMELSCREAAITLRDGAVPTIAFLGGFRNAVDGTSSANGIYQMAKLDDSWREPVLLVGTIGANRDFSISRDGILSWQHEDERFSQTLQMTLPAWGHAAGPITIVSSEPVSMGTTDTTLAPTRLPPKKWTFVCYLDGDNSLSSFAIQDMNEMELVGSNADINIIVLYDSTGAADSAAYYVTYDTADPGFGSTVIPLSSINSTWGSEVNMGNAQTAIDLMKYVYTNYPAQKYGFDFWNHGGSWTWMQCEDAVSSDELTALDTRTIYEKLRAQTGRRYLFDTLCFDECITADNEVAYDAKQYANYSVFSEDSIAGDGFDYTDVLNHIKNNPNMGGEEFGAWVCHEYYADYPTGTALSTLALINNTAYDYDLMEAIENLGQKLRHKASTLNAQIKSAASSAMDWQGITYQPDLRHFCELLRTGITNATDAQINAAAFRVIQLTGANAATDTYGSPTWQHNRPILIHDANTNANGLTIYANQAYDTTFNSLAIAPYSNWDAFVQNVWGTPADVNNVEPTVAITSPSEGAYVVYNTVATISGTAADSGTVQRVEVKIDREAWQTATGTTSWTYNWNLAGWAPGPHRIQARSYDGTDYSMLWADKNVTEIVDPNLADLTLWPNQITFSNPTPNEGDTITIGATIHNVGTVNDAANVQVGFYVGNPAAGGSLIGTYVTTTPSTIVHNNGTGVASTTWNTAGWAGSRDIYVVADPGYAINELTDANNTKSKTLLVAGYAVDLTCIANISTVQAGASHNYPITVKNTGTMTDTIRMTIDNPTTWVANFNNNPITKDATIPAEQRLVSGYHTYAEVQAELAALAAANPTIAKTYKLATTAEGRNVTVLKISDNVATNESEPGALIIGNHHAREWMTIEIPLYYANYILNNYGADPQATWLVDNREIYILPNLNPDGLQYSQFTDNMWRKNRRNNGDGTFGVDLNRNYDGSQNGDPNGAWGTVGTSHTTSDDTYCGPSAFSEPETQAVRDLILAKTNLALSISFHSYAEEIYWPWGYSTGVQTPDHLAQQSVAVDFAAINGYTPVQSAVPYATSGDTDDWAYGYFEYHSARTFFPFTIETNNQFQPPASEIIPTCQLNLDVCLEGAKRAGDLLKTAPTITHTPLPNTINMVTPYNVVASFASPAGVDASSLQMFWKTSGSYTQVAMTPTGTPGQYQASIPAQTDGSWVSYYVRGASTPGTSSTSPNYAPNARNSFFVGSDIVVYNVTLAPGASKIVNLTVVAPAGALPNAQAKIDVIGTSVGNALKTDSVETVTTVSPAILLVNDGNAAIAQYQTALTNGGYKYDNGTPTSDLSDYRIVIWATDGSATLADTEKTALSTFMNAGGSVYINGEDIGYDIAADADGFYATYLHATYLADSSGGTLVNGVVGDPITNGMANYDISGSYPDAIGMADASASTIFRYNDATTRAGGLKADTGVYKLVYISCEYFEGTTDSQANKNLLMQRIIEWLNPDRAPTVSVTAPTATNTIVSGSYTIRWTATDDNTFPAGPIDIDYSANGGSTWSPVVTNVANSGSYVWDTTGRTDGVNYLLRVTATDSIGQSTTDVSDNPFSIDNIVNDQWHLQVQTSVAGFKDLDMKPVELADNTFNSSITAAGQYLVGSQRFLSGALASAANVAGTWTFDVWGRVTASAADGRLYAKVYSYNGVTTTLLFTTANDDETVGAYTVFHEFSWTYGAPSGSVPAGQKICVEIWLDATAGSGNSNVQNLANHDIPISGTVTGTYIDTQTQNDAYEVVTEVAGPASFVIYSNDFESGVLTGWTLGGASNDWQIGAPTGLGTPADPTSAYSGTRCIGNDITGLGTYPGEYENSLVADSNYIYTPVINCAGYTGVSLRFMRWLGVESSTYDHAYIEASRAPGGPWTQIWTNTATSFSDTAWTQFTYSIATVADNQAAVYVRFEIGATDGSVTYCGWNIDDFTILGNRTTSYLEHKWTVSVPAGKNPYTFRIDAYRTTSADNDNFVFAYSTNNVTFTDMVTVTATTDTDAYLTYALPISLNGTVYIRVRDTVRTAGLTVLDIIRIDHMYIESVEGPPQMIIAYDHGAHQSYIRPSLAASSAYYRIPVIAGWNFISMPIVPASTALPGALTDSNGDTAWTRAMWYNPQTPTDMWKQYNSAWPGAMNDLKNVDQNMGVWLFVTTVGDGYINVTGTLPTTTAIQLRTGWNLVGFPSDDTTYTVAMLKAACPTVTIVEQFDGAQTYKTSVMADAALMAPGKAYWVYTSADTVWNKAY